MSSTVAKELCELADEIAATLIDSPCLSVASPIVSHCVDHLRLLASWHEAIGLREDNNNLKERLEDHRKATSAAYQKIRNQ
jgi:hypothetical protein